MANDMIVQTTVDRRVMDVLRNFLEGNGADIRSISELARLSLETLASIAVNKFNVPETLDSTEATENLQRITYGSALLNNRRQGSKFLENLQTSAKADGVQFDEAVAMLPKTRGRTPQWTEADAERMKAVAEKALESSRIKALMEKYRTE
jgi:hypothetical protein